jgi:hypothetical protein
MSFPANGAAVNMWDTINPGGVNTNFTIVDAALGGVTALNATGASGTVTLTAAQYIPPNIEISGTLSAAVTYQIPAGVGGFWSINNAASGAYAVNFAIAGSNPAVIPAGAGRVLLISDGAQLAYMSGFSPAPGVTGEVIFNSSGLFAASTNMTFDGTNLVVAGNVTSGVALNAVNAVISGTLSGAALTTLFAAPPAIGATTPAAARFTSAATPPNAIGNSGAAFTVDASRSNVHAVTMTAASTMTLSNMVSGQTINVQITQDATGGRVITWPAGLLWLGGVTPALSAAAAAIDMLVITCVGTNFLAALGKGY